MGLLWGNVGQIGRFLKMHYFPQKADLYQLLLTKFAIFRTRHCCPQKINNSPLIDVVALS